MRFRRICLARWSFAVALGRLHQWSGSSRDRGSGLRPACPIDHCCVAITLGATDSLLIAQDHGRKVVYAAYNTNMQIRLERSTSR